MKLARFFGKWQCYNWLGSSRFDFWQEHYHIIDWSKYSKLGEIWFSVVIFHLVHSSDQVTTWWWSKSSSGYKHNWRDIRSQRGFVSISLTVVRLWGSNSKLYSCLNNTWSLLPKIYLATFWVRLSSDRRPVLGIIDYWQCHRLFIHLRFKFVINLSYMIFLSLVNSR